MVSDRLIAHAHRLAADIAPRVGEIEQANRLPDTVVEAFIEAEFPAILVPRSRGGFELDLDTVAPIVCIFAAICPSVAWNLCFYIGQNGVVCQMPEAFQDLYFAGGAKPLLAGSLVPTFVLTPVSGGFLATGRASWCSGAPHADFLLLAGRTRGEGGERRMVFGLDKAAATLVDSWAVEGMRATGSIDVSLDDVFIPAEHALVLDDLMAGTGEGALLYPDNPMYRRPAELMALSYQLPVFVGACRGAADELLDVSRHRIHTNTGAAAAARPSVQAHVGHAHARATIAEGMLAAIVQEAMCGSFTASSRVAWRTRCTLVAEFCREAITDATRAAGANAFRKQSRLQMLFRDINMISLHPALEREGATELLGGLLLSGDRVP